MAAAVRAGWAKGIPAHITLCYPFIPPQQVDDRSTERLTALLRGTAPFPFRFTRTNRFPAALWLAPEPCEPFRDLTETLCLGFPSVRPYGGQFDRVIPHLTIADRVTEATMDRLTATDDGEPPLSGSTSFGLTVEAANTAPTFGTGGGGPDGHRR